MNDYPFSIEDDIIEVLEENKKRITAPKYAYQKARKVLEVLKENEIPKSNEVLELAEEWLHHLKEE